MKRAEAAIAAVHQVAGYLLALGKRDDFASGRLDGVLVAERISSTVRAAAVKEGVAVYEARWPLALSRVAWRADRIVGHPPDRADASEGA